MQVGAPYASVVSKCFDLLSDFHPHGSVAETYGVAREGGISERAIFVVDKGGLIAFAKIYDIPTLPDNAEVRRIIEQLPS